MLGDREHRQKRLAPEQKGRSSWRRHARTRPTRRSADGGASRRISCASSTSTQGTERSTRSRRDRVDRSATPDVVALEKKLQRTNKALRELANEGPLRWEVPSKFASKSQKRLSLARAAA